MWDRDPLLDTKREKGRGGRGGASFSGCLKGIKVNDFRLFSVLVM